MSSSPQPAAVLQGIRKDYPMGKISVPALKGIDLTLQRGDFVSVAGPSGSGKTTMMNLLGLIDTPTAGSLFVNGQAVQGLSRKKLTRLRRETIGFIFQSFNLMPVLNVQENVALPLMLSKNRTSRKSRKERNEWAGHLLEEVGLGDRMDHRPSELSGGQQQRVAVARALAGRPPIVIADEPTANLDSETGERILNLMKRINQEEGTTFIFSTHDPTIWEMADHIVFLHDGLIEKEER